MRWDSSGPSNVGSSGSSISSVQFSIRTLLVPLSAIGKSDHRATERGYMSTYMPFNIYSMSSKTKQQKMWSLDTLIKVRG